MGRKIQEFLELRVRVKEEANVQVVFGMYGKPRLKSSPDIISSPQEILPKLNVNHAPQTHKATLNQPKMPYFTNLRRPERKRKLSIINEEVFVSTKTETLYD